MENKKSILMSLLLCASVSSCISSPDNNIAETTDFAAADAANPLLQKWQGPYQGVPNFDKMDLKDLKPAVELAIEQSLASLEKIASNPDAPTFENTILAMESNDQAMDSLFAYYGIWSANLSTPEFREIQSQLSPIFSAYQSKIRENIRLFSRIETVYKQLNQLKLEPDQMRLVELIYKQSVRDGVNLDEKTKARYAAINEQLAQLYVKFGNNVLADEENYVLYLEKDQLVGLPDSFVQGAAATATERGQQGKYAITNTRSSMDPFLTFSQNRALREKVWKTYYSRGDNGDEFDNNEIIAQILALRDERVKLLGFKNYASWRLENKMAKTPDQAEALMLKLWPAAISRVSEEVADMQAVADKEKANIKIQAWDYRFYAEKVRRAKYSVDSNEVKEYLQLDQLREAMFYVAGRLFDFSFTPVKEGTVPVFHEDVKVWEVTNLKTGKHVGLWYLDPYARTGKQSGAWATSFRSHTNLGAETNVLASNNSNFIKPAPGDVVLVSWDDATTFFHEFGHALHALSSNVRYPTLNGGVGDYTEFQSQLLERWLMTDEVINKYLLHYKTNKPMPPSLIVKIKKAANFNQGFDTTEYLASALIDMKLHTANPPPKDPRAFEKETLKSLKMPSELVMRHRTAQFGHVFSGEGYAAGYYGYLWAEVLTSDAAEAFKEAPGGFYDEQLSDRLVKYLFAPSNAIDPAEAYRKFRGKEAKAEALMRDRGFLLNK